MDKKRLVIFSISFVLPFLYYRILVFFLPGDYISPIRRVTGLGVHHFHYGILILTIAVLMILFYRIYTPSVILAGLGLGLIGDTFFPSLFLETVREQELIAYSQHFSDTLILFGVIIILAVVISIIFNKRKKH